MTVEQRKNLDAAMQLAAERVGWKAAPAGMPYELRDEYRTELARIIIAYPDRFAEETIKIANRELTNAPDQALESYTLGQAVGDFAGEFGNQALELGESVAAVGEGVKSTLSLTRWVLPVAALFAAYVFLRGFARKHG